MQVLTTWSHTCPGLVPGHDLTVSEAAEAKEGA